MSRVECIINCILWAHLSSLINEYNIILKYKVIYLIEPQLSQLKMELTQLGVSLSEFGAKVLGESDHSGSVLTHPPRLLDELDSKVLPKFLTIQQWVCKSQEQKLKPFKSWQIQWGYENRTPNNRTHLKTGQLFHMGNRRIRWHAYVMKQVIKVLTKLNEWIIFGG